MQQFREKLKHDIVRQEPAEKDLPIKSPDELFNWFGSVKGPTPKWTPTPLTRIIKSSAYPGNTEVILCHDMRGGYLDDANCFGSDNPVAYRFYHWTLIDCFIYFSHHLVTIPPVAWIDIAHRNGVRVLGCFLTEGWIEEGQAAFNLIFSSLSLAKFVARQLDNIRKFYKFEGWLINLENKIPPEFVSTRVPIIEAFLTTLRNLGSEVIWYDAVTDRGELGHQNALTDRNEKFFKAAGSIFLNYSWNLERLISSQKLAGSLSQRVFVGVDCFGRGTPGGGGYHTNQALSIIRKVERPSLSIALFAPGWIYETTIQSGDFLQDNDRFWKLMAPLLRQPGVSSPVCVPQSAEFGVHLDTTFCLGQGVNRYEKARLAAIGYWDFIGVQQIMPDLTDERYKIIPERSLAFTGANCIRVSLARSPPESQSITADTLPDSITNETYVTMFYLNIPVKSLSTVKLVFTVDPITNNNPLIGLCLRFSSGRLVRLAGWDVKSAASTNPITTLVGSEAQMIGQRGRYGDQEMTWIGWQWDSLGEVLTLGSDGHNRDTLERVDLCVREERMAQASLMIGQLRIEAALTGEIM